jgi:hypothetical protein
MACNRDIFTLLYLVTARHSFAGVTTAPHARQPLCWNFLYNSRTVLSVGGSVWYLIQSLSCTVTNDSVLANSKTQKSFLSPDPAMFRNDCPLAEKPGSTPWRLLPIQTWKDSLPTDMLLSAVSVLVAALPSSEVPEEVMNYSVYCYASCHAQSKSRSKTRSVVKCPWRKSRSRGWRIGGRVYSLLNISTNPTGLVLSGHGLITIY